MAAARMDWVMSPSSGDALLCFVKRTVPAGSKGTSWYRQDYTQHKVVVPGASRCLAKVAHQAGGYPQKVDCQLNLNPRALSRIHHNAKDSLWLKILSCYVPVFSPLQARWYPFKPVYIKGKSNDF